MSIRKFIDIVEKHDITETEAFKRWFAGSKVVDEHGRPKVLYHGTRQDVRVFTRDPDADVKSYGFNRVGFWFDADPETPAHFAQGPGGNIMPVYLSIKRPLVLTSEHMWEKHEEKLQDLWRVFRELPEPDYNDSDQVREISKKREAIIDQIKALKKERGSDAFDRLMSLMGGSRVSDEDADAFVADVRAEGYDGIYLENTLADDGSRGGRKTDWWIALDPHQIKSKFNRGTFDPNSDDVSESR